MNSKSKYKTRQGDELQRYLETIPGKHFTVKDIVAYFNTQDKNIGTATVYRHLENLIDEGFVNKYIIDESSPACFEYMGQETHVEGISCFHCKCQKCGKLIHLHCGELEMIQNHLMAEHSFALDPKRTVFYGICEQCRQED